MTSDSGLQNGTNLKVTISADVPEFERKTDRL